MKRRKKSLNFTPVRWFFTIVLSLATYISVSEILSEFM